LGELGEEIVSFGEKKGQFRAFWGAEEWTDFDQLHCEQCKIWPAIDGTGNRVKVEVYWFANQRGS
jgi:hypothetical protein